MLTEHKHVLKALADALYERETLEADEIDAVIIEVAGADALPERPEPPAPESREKKEGLIIAPEAEEEAQEAAGMSPEGVVPETA